MHFIVPNVREIIAILIATGLLAGLGFFVHGKLLMPDYARYPNIVRPPNKQMPLMPLMMLAHLAMAAGIVYLHRHLVIPGRGWFGEGIRLGAALAAIAVVPKFLIYYVILPISLRLAIKQIICDAVVMLIIGLVVCVVL